MHGKGSGKQKNPAFFTVPAPGAFRNGTGPRKKSASGEIEKQVLENKAK